MKDSNNNRQTPLSSLIVEDNATEKIKKHAQDWGLIVNAGAGRVPKQPIKKEGGKK